jgi:hypothetical protein
MPKKRYRPDESIEEQRRQTVCAGFAFSCHFLSYSVTSCPLGGRHNRLKTLRRRGLWEGATTVRSQVLYPA